MPDGRLWLLRGSGGEGLAWAGLAADPFTADGAALDAFLQAVREGRYDPKIFTTSPSNVFEGRDVTAIALKLPDAALGGTQLSVWARISVQDHVVTYRPGQPAAFHPGHGNERALGDNAFDHAVAVLAGSALGNSSTPPPATEAFPYLSASQPADLPPLIGGAPAAG